MNKTSKITIALISIVAAVFLALFIYFLSISTTYKIQLENNYKKAFYELSGNVQDIEVDLSKLVATNNIKTQRDILNEIYQLSVASGGNISSLPISNQKISSVNKYLNTLGGYTFSLLEKVNSGAKLDSADFDNIVWLHKDSKILAYDIAQYINDNSANEYILDNVKYSSGDDSQFDGGLTKLTNKSNSVPTLIYDGPFSDSVVNKKIKGITGDLITEEQALAIVKDCFDYFDNYTYTYVSDTDGKFATYNFNLQASNYTLYVQITKVGGFILSVNLLNSTNVDAKLDNASAQVLASNYLKLIGFDDVTSVWTQDTGNVVYFNFAYFKEGIVYYPDLIKVKVDKGLERVIGMDASNYAYNHVERPEYTAQLSVEEASALLNPTLNVVNVQKCVIPNKWVGESGAYEFECTWDEYTYFVYLSAINGDELNIVRLVDTTSGELTQ